MSFKLYLFRSLVWNGMILLFIHPTCYHHIPSVRCLRRFLNLVFCFANRLGLKVLYSWHNSLSNSFKQFVYITRSLLLTIQDVSSFQESWFWLPYFVFHFSLHEMMYFMYFQFSNVLTFSPYSYFNDYFLNHFSNDHYFCVSLLIFIPCLFHVL